MPSHQFVIEHCYFCAHFQGILPDTSAAEISTAGYEQYLAYQRENPDIRLNKNAPEVSIKFRKGPVISSIGSVDIQTPFGQITFHVLETPTLFLLCVGDMDWLGVYLNNVTNELVHNNVRYPVIRKWGYPWVLFNKLEAIIYLTNVELRRFHRRFGHPATDRLYRLLEKAGHEPHHDALQTIAQFCHHCQMNGAAP